jgi:heme-degrading monooxygenase HmoA
MFSVLFEVHPRPEKSDAYLGYAKMLKPELEKIEGFIDNVRYRSLTREGWMLSLSNWRDEKSLVRWRTLGVHHGIQEKGRNEVFLDYHLRVGQITHDTQLPTGYSLNEQRLDETETGEATTVTLINAKQSPEWVKQKSPEDIAKWLGFNPKTAGVAAWDIFDAVLTSGDIILFIAWRDKSAAEAFESSLAPSENARLRRVRIIRDYGMFDRREAPQFYPEAQSVRSK